MNRFLRITARLLAVAAVSALAWVSAAHAFSADPYEPDGSRATAKPIPVGDTIKDLKIQNRTIVPLGDRDWASFTASAGVTYYFATLPNPESMRMNGNVYDAAGTLLKGLRGTQGPYSNNNWTAGADGTYYVRFDSPKVMTASPGRSYPQVGAYAIRVGQAPPSARELDPSEPDDTTATAKPMPKYQSMVPFYVMNTLVKGKWHTTSNPGSAVDTDTYFLDVTANQTNPYIGVGICMASDSVTRHFLRVEVVGPGGNIVGTTPQVYVGVGPLGNAVWAFEPPTAGRYWIRIFGQSQPYYYRPYCYINSVFGIR